MKWSIKKYSATFTTIVLCLTLFLCLMSFRATAAESENAVTYDNISIGAGASFYAPLINPTDSNNYIVLNDMNDIYYSLNAGESWGRSETMTNFYHACFSDDGILYVGGACLYASTDKGQTITSIYPREEDVQAISSRNGRNNVVFMAEGHDGGYVTCMDTLGDRVYFITLDWTTERTFQLLSCKSDGTDLVRHMVKATYMSASPQDVDYHLLATETGLYFSDGTILHFYDFASGLLLPVYYADGKILDLEQIEDQIFILDDTDAGTKILYSKDLVTFQNLCDYNTLPNSFERYGYTQYFRWHFRAISGNTIDSIFLAFSSPVEWTGAPIEDLGGVMKFDGEKFNWVFDPIFQNRGEYNLQGWSFGSYYPINDLCADPNNDDHCLMANIDTVYDVHFGTEKQDVQYLHCGVKTIDGKKYYTSTGLDAQVTTFTRVDPHNPQHILIGTSDIGLQISVDGGESFCRMQVDPAYSNIYNTCYDVYFDPNVSGLVYGLWSDRHGAPYIPLLSDRNAHGYFAISRDGGVSWDFTYSTGLPENAIPIRMSVRQEGDELVFAVATYNDGFFLSVDSGRTFTCVSEHMDSYDGLIWGQDVVLTEDYLYCLTAWHTFGGSTPSVLYKVNRETGETIRIDLGKIVNTRSLTYDPTYGLYLNAIHNTKWGMRQDIGAKFDVNTDGGVYQINEDDTLTYLLNVEMGVSSSGFTSDGTMYVVGDKGTVYVRPAGEEEFSVYVQRLFTRMLNITFTPNGCTLYITTLGGGTYRMPTLMPDVENALPSAPPSTNATYTVTFQKDSGEILSQQTVSWGGSATAPSVVYRLSDETYCYTFTGWDMDTSFVVCDMVVTAQFEAKVHSPVTHYQKDATCTSTGSTGHQYCAYCGKKLSSGKVIPKLQHQPSEPRNNGNGTHSIICTLCNATLSTSACANNGKGQCTGCGEVLVSQRFASATSLVKGQTYLITFDGLTFGYGMTPESTELYDYDGGFIPGHDIPKDMLWTYNGTCLYTVHEGTTYYLSLAFRNGKLIPAVNSSRSWAFQWVCREGSLAVQLSVGYYSYLDISSTSLGLSNTATDPLTLYWLVP